MKKLILLGLIFGLAVGVTAQKYTPDLYKTNEQIAVFKPARLAVDDPTGPVKPGNQLFYGTMVIDTSIIGNTKYDLQSNGSMQNRIYLHSDGTIGAVWTKGHSETAYPDRGTGYNYFNGTVWDSWPTARIENTRTGWPSYAPLGPGGEIVVSHNGNTGLEISKRTTKGTGTWNETTYLGPVQSNGSTTILWPRMITAGDNHDTVHIIAVTDNTSGVTYQGLTMGILYSRSKDGGNTWDINNIVIPGMDTSQYTGFGPDGYAWAKPQGNNLVFVVGDNWTDVFLMKSDDAGNTWTKTMIFQHPYPMFKETTTLVLDTPYVCDGSLSIALDNNGMAHVLFGTYRVLNNDTTDANTHWFPYTGGLVYWNESMGPLSTLDPDTLYNNGNLIGYLFDTDGNGTFDWVGTTTNIANIGKYYVSIASMSNIIIDENDSIYISFSLITENYHNTVQHYRHLFSRKSSDYGATWSDFTDLTFDKAIFEYIECVYASLSYTFDTSFHIILQGDIEPGVSVAGDEDSPSDANFIFYLNVPRSDWGNPAIGIREKENIGFITQNYPNPFSESTSIKVGLNKPAKLSLAVYNMMGQKMLEIDKGNVNGGLHQFTINRGDLTSGIYFYTIVADKQSISKKMIVH